MKLRTLALTAIMAMSVIGPANGATVKNTFLKAHLLLERCESESLTAQNFCWGYIEGVNDAQATFESWGETPMYYCLEERLTTGQLVNAFINYAQKNSDKLHLVASGLVLYAFNEAFPCD